MKKKMRPERGGMRSKMKETLRRRKDTHYTSTYMEGKIGKEKGR